MFLYVQRKSYLSLQSDIYDRMTCIFRPMPDRVQTLQFSIY